MSENIVVDAVGEIPVVGSRVVFAPGQKGAQQFVHGVVEKITDKCVKIEYVTRGRHWKTKEIFEHTETVLRGPRCFVIVENV